MDSAGTFFVSVLLLQLIFSGTMVWLVGRRFPRRVPVYRFVAPAAVPVLLFTIAAAAFVAQSRAQGLSVEGGPLGRLALAYLVLWLVGVLFASMVMRWLRR